MYIKIFQEIIVFLNSHSLEDWSKHTDEENKFGTIASILPQKSRTFPSVSGKNRNMPKRLADQI